MRLREKASSISFRDVMLALNGTLAAATLIVLALIGPITKIISENIRPAGQISMLVCWNRAPIDIDTLGLAPGEDKPVFFRNKSGKVLTLNTDNRGETGGKAPANCELMVARDLPAGEYIFNVFGFSVSEVTNVHVEIGIGKDAGSMHVYPFDVPINHRQERTIMRFKINGNGNIVPGSINQVFKPLFIGS